MTGVKAAYYREKPRYRFSHRGSDGRLYWHSVLPIPGGSRHEQVACSAEWFYGQMVKQPIELIIKRVRAAA